MKGPIVGILKPLDRPGSPIEHGGPDLEELHRFGFHPKDILDFSVCTNPFGPSPHVKKALAKVSIEQYPDRQSSALKEALAEKHRLSPGQILVGNGASELIGLAAQAFVRPGERVLIIGPTYGEYARSTLSQGGIISFWNAQKENGFLPDVGNIEAALQRFLPRLVFLCNPNNPTGTIIAPKVILSWARKFPNVLFVVDEAYQQFAPGLQSLVNAQEPNLLIIRSMTKDYALAGLRIGYAVGLENHIRHLLHVQCPWSVNAMAQAAALAALGDDNHLAQTLENLERAKQEFIEGLTELGFSIQPSEAHYFLMKVGDASAFRSALIEQGVLVRKAASFGLPAYVRLATRKPEDNARLLALLRGNHLGRND
jgi:histidinol-phosphate aminotransferase